jgi:hypothetical protein
MRMASARAIAARIAAVENSQSGILSLCMPGGTLFMGRRLVRKDFYLWHGHGASSAGLLS